MATVQEQPDAWQSLEELRDRITYTGDELYSQNSQLRFDELLVQLEEESRGIFKTLWGDQPIQEETDRVDVKRATDDTALMLVYPIQSITSVEIKRSQADNWETLDSDRYTHTDHRLILEGIPRTSTSLVRRHRNELTDYADRWTWRDICVELRVTYDRGFSNIPTDVQNIQIQLMNRMIRKMRLEDSFAAASPDELAGVSTDFDTVLTDQLRQRILDVTSPGGATMSV